MARKDNDAGSSELITYRKQLADTREKLKSDPDNDELRSLKDQLEELIPLLEAAEEEEDQSVPKQPTPPPPPPPPEQKWSKENHPAFQPGYRQVGQPEQPAPKTPVVLQVNDTVKAKWISGDKQFWTARIISMTGSAADPIYTVKFKGYDDTDNVRSKDILPITHDSKKRKAEDSPVDSIPPPPPPPQQTGVISGAASIDPALASKAKKEQEGTKEKKYNPNKAPRQLKGQKELAANQSSWKSFQAKGSRSAKVTQKDSMFRTGEGLNARVGYIGSGKAMSKDPVRHRHVFQKGGDGDDEEENDE